MQTPALVLLALSLLGARLVDASAQDVNAAEALASVPAAASEPMAAFARMTVGEWRLGNVQTDTWQWGPGEHSMHVRTVGLDGEGRPWRELMICYWHPARQQVCLLGFHPDIPGIGRGVASGTIRFDAETVTTAVDLYQPGTRRRMGGRWAFDGPDAYHEVLLEDSGRGLRPLAEWDYVRSMQQRESPAPAPGPAPTPSSNIQAFVPLLGHWETRDDDGAIVARSNFEWMEYLDVVALRVEGPSAAEAPEHLLDVYLYHHVGTDELRCLALSASGGVYEGDVDILDEGALQVHLTGVEPVGDAKTVVRLEPGVDGTARLRVWSVADAQRTLVLDVRHERVHPRPDEPDPPQTSP